VNERLHILVVEDDGIYADFVAATLRVAGHDVAIAPDAAAARKHVELVQADAVVLDLGLPDESGYDLARDLRSHLVSARTVIILLTANLYPERDLASAVGIDMVLTKPVEAELVHGIVDFIRNRRGRRLERRE
jgi:DNA-binding response OmpR family regulator